MGRFILIKKTNGLYQFKLVASNGQILLTSGEYAIESACKNGIKSVEKNAKDEGKFDRMTTSNGKFYFTIRAMNGQVIAESELYESEAARENGIYSVRRNSQEIEIVKNY